VKTLGTVAGGARRWMGRSGSSRSTWPPPPSGPIGPLQWAGLPGPADHSSGRWSLRRRAGTVCAVLALALLTLAAPARALQWYEHYEAGVSAEQRGAWQEALASFEQAERFRPEPAARVRTYGNRFLFDYDPPFHVARCLLGLGRYAEARAALARSAAAGVTPEAERTKLAREIDRREGAARPQAGSAVPRSGAEPGTTGTTVGRAPASAPGQEPGPGTEAERPESSGAGAPEKPAAAVDRTASAAATPNAPGTLVVESTPPGAEVSVDGRQVGKTPIEGIEVAPGARRLRVSGARLDGGWGTWEQVLEVEAGERVHVDVALARTQPAAVATNRGTPSAAPEGRLDGGARPGGPSTAGSGPPAASQALSGRAGETGGSDRPASPSTDRPGAEQAGAPAGAVEARAERPASPSDSVGEPAPASAAGSEGEPASPTGSTSKDALVAQREALARNAALGALLVVLVAAGAVWWVLRRRVRGAPASTQRTGTGGSGGVGGQVGGYRLQEVLGRGGMATTYRAERISDGRPVALKIPHETGDPTYLERFLREGRLGETLHHPGIVRIIEAGTAGGGSAPPGEGERPFLAMELLPGRTVRQVLDAAAADEAPLPIERCLQIAVEIAEALDYAHGKGVVHRDLKPENVMVLPDGSLKVMDFGVARVEGQPGLTTSRFFFGSPVYAAPELVDPRTIDRRVDLYSLGVLLYELLEGEPPFVHESIFKLLEMHQSAPLPAPSELPRALPPDLWQVVARLLAKDREERYGSAEVLLVDLHRLATAPTSPSAPECRR